MAKRDAGSASGKSRAGDGRRHRGRRDRRCDGRGDTPVEERGEGAPQAREASGERAQDRDQAGHSSWPRRWDPRAASRSRNDRSSWPPPRRTSPDWPRSWRRQRHRRPARPPARLVARRARSAARWVVPQARSGAPWAVPQARPVALLPAQPGPSAAQPSRPARPSARLAARPGQAPRPATKRTTTRTAKTRRRTTTARRRTTAKPAASGTPLNGFGHGAARRPSRHARRSPPRPIAAKKPPDEEAGRDDPQARSVQEARIGQQGHDDHEGCDGNARRRPRPNPARPSRPRPSRPRPSRQVRRSRSRPRRPSRPGRLPRSRVRPNRPPGAGRPDGPPHVVLRRRPTAAARPAEAVTNRSAPVVPADSRQAIGAAVDLGSNSVHLLVARVVGHRLERRRRPVRLPGARRGDRRARAPRPARSRRAGRDARGLRRNRPRPRGHDRHVPRARSRSVARRTPPGSSTRSRPPSATPLHVLSHEEEAFLTVIGVTEGMPVTHETLVVDVGGGSTECCVVDARHRPRAVGLRLGSAMLGRRQAAGDPPTSADLDAMRGHGGRRAPGRSRRRAPRDRGRRRHGLEPAQGPPGSGRRPAPDPGADRRGRGDPGHGAVRGGGRAPSGSTRFGPACCRPVA